MQPANSTGRQLTAVAVVAGVGVGMVTTVRPLWSVAVVAAAAGLATMLWRSRLGRLRRQVAAVLLTTVVMFAAAGWGAVTGDAAVGAGAAGTVTTLCVGAAIVAGASAGYYQLRIVALGDERLSEETPPTPGETPASANRPAVGNTATTTEVTSRDGR